MKLLLKKGEPKFSPPCTSTTASLIHSTICLLNIRQNYSSPEPLIEKEWPDRRARILSATGMPSPWASQKKSRNTQECFVKHLRIKTLHSPSHAVMFNFGCYGSLIITTAGGNSHELAVFDYRRRMPPGRSASIKVSKPAEVGELLPA